MRNHLFPVLFGASRAPLASQSFFSDGGSAPFWMTGLGPAAAYDSSNTKTWFTWERGVVSDNKRLVMCATLDDAGNWAGNYLVGKSTLTSDPHGEPAICPVGGYGFCFYGPHESAIKVASTANANDPTIWFDQPDISGTHTFQNVIGDATKIYLSNTIPSPSVGGGNQAAIEMRVYTPSSATLGAATSTKTLVDGYDGSHFGWLPIGQMFESPDGTENYILCPYAITIAETITGIYLIRWVKATGSIKNWDGTHTVLSASQPISKADLDTYFKIATPTDGGMPTGCVDAGGAIHITYGDGASSLNGVLKYTTAAAGGAFSTPATIYTFPASVDPINIEAGVLPRSDSGIDVYFSDGTAGYAFPGSGNTIAGNLMRMTRSSAGAWSGARRVLTMNGQGLDEPVPIYRGNTRKLIVTEVSSDYTTMTGALRGFVLDANGLQIPRASVAHSSLATNFLARTSNLSANETAACYELLDGIAAAGLDSSLDFLHAYCLSDRTSAKLNMIGNVFNAAEVGTLSFIAGDGFNGWGDASYLNPSFDGSTGSPKFLRNSASLGTWCIGNAQGGATIGVANLTGAISYIYPRYSDNKMYGSLNAVSDVDGGQASTDSSGMTSVARRASDRYRVFKNGVFQYETLSTSAAPAIAVTIGGGHSSLVAWNSGGTISLAWLGAGLTDNQMRQLYMLFYVFMVRVAGIS